MTESAELTQWALYSRLVITLRSALASGREYGTGRAGTTAFPPLRPRSLPRPLTPPLTDGLMDGRKRVAWKGHKRTRGRARICKGLKVHKIENFFDSDFGICVISLLVMSKY